MIPFDQISVKDECHALFQPAVRGLPCDSEGVDVCVSARMKGHAHLCVCVCVCRLGREQAAPEVRMPSGRISFQSPVPSFNTHSDAHTEHLEFFRASPQQH